MNGQPCVRHMRLTVRRVLEALAAYPDRAKLLREYPELKPEVSGRCWLTRPQRLMTGRRAAEERVRLLLDRDYPSLGGEAPWS
jgi:uncharacterized protein (DUF433 family)